MTTTILDGPIHISGDTQQIPASVEGTTGTVPDPNTDAGPSMLYQGVAIPDVRYFYPKDKVPGFTGVMPMIGMGMTALLTSQIPAAQSTTNIAAAQNVTANTAMTLATAQATGIAPAIPVMPFSWGFGGTPVNALALDFGFAFGNVTSGSKTITVADSTQFTLGMPLVIGGVGNSAGTSALLTNVTGLPTATTITVQDAPSATNATAPIGTGNLWGPSENGFPTPTAALPYIAKGPGLFLDSRQSLSRGVVITGTVGGSGGNFIVAGYDIYGQAMTSLVTVPPNAQSGFTTKAFKYLTSVTPQFTDAHGYSVGTSDVFGLALRADDVSQTDIWWANSMNTTNQAFTNAVATSPATNATGDVRGTIQASSNGPVAGITSPASNGTIVSLAMSGLRLAIAVRMTTAQQVYTTQSVPTPLYGVTQV